MLWCELSSRGQIKVCSSLSLQKIHSSSTWRFWKRPQREVMPGRLCLIGQALWLQILYFCLHKVVVAHSYLGLWDWEHHPGKAICKRHASSAWEKPLCAWEKEWLTLRTALELSHPRVTHLECKRQSLCGKGCSCLLHSRVSGTKWLPLLECTRHSLAHDDCLLAGLVRGRVARYGATDTNS